MPEKRGGKSLWIMLGAAGILIILGAFVFMTLYSPDSRDTEERGRAEHTAPESSGSEQGTPSDEKETAEQTTGTLPENRIVKEARDTDTGDERETIEIPSIDYQSLDEDPRMDRMMEKRKEKFGLDESVDMIVKSDESFSVGGREISMERIIEKAFLKRGEIYETSIDGPEVKDTENARAYGIYVVQPGDNVWNIHFDILKDYYDSRGISVEPEADEPDETGMSSGLGKILKFSEKTVIIYNLAEDRIDTNIDLIQPLTKIVVYNLGRVFNLLEEISYKNVDKVKFDGTTIWIATDKDKS
ncbi:MAG: hypothetical protein R6V41_10155 [Desulfobacteraceae bacterium]